MQWETLKHTKPNLFHYKQSDYFQAAGKSYGELEIGA